MKALSIKQPFASLIAHGIKDIENRTWKTKYRGRIYIHASGTPSFKDLINNLPSDQLEEVIRHQYLFSMNTNSKSYPKSAIIGEVDIIDCVINHPSVWAEETFIPIDETEGYPQKPIYNWVLANAVLYDKPILNVKGKLSLWDYEMKYESYNNRTGEITPDKIKSHADRL